MSYKVRHKLALDDQLAYRLQTKLLRAQRWTLIGWFSDGFPVAKPLGLPLYILSATLFWNILKHSIPEGQTYKHRTFLTVGHTTIEHS